MPWLYRMWTDKPAAWFVQWEAIGHRVNHLGEMVVGPQPPRPEPVLTVESSAAASAASR